MLDLPEAYSPPLFSALRFLCFSLPLVLPQFVVYDSSWATGVPLDAAPPPFHRTFHTADFYSALARLLLAYSVPSSSVAIWHIPVYSTPQVLESQTHHLTSST